MAAKCPPLLSQAGLSLIGRKKKTPILVKEANEVGGKKPHAIDFHSIRADSFGGSHFKLVDSLFPAHGDFVHC